MRRIIVAVCALALAAFLWTAAPAETTADGLVYEVYYYEMGYVEEEYDDDGNLIPGEIEWGEYIVITGYDAALLPEHVVIPSDINGVSVIGIGADDWHHIYSDSSGAFRDAPMKSITMEGGGIVLGANTFANCANLESADLADCYVDQSGWDVYGMMHGCANLKSVKLFGGMANLDINDVFGDTWGDDARCTLEEIVVPRGVQTVDCEKMPNLKRLVLPDTVTSLTLSGVESEALPWTSLPQGLRSLSLEGFTNLASLELPQGLTFVSLHNMPLLDEIDIPSSVTTLSITRCNRLTELEIPAGITAINSFSDNRQLVRISIPDGATAIGANAFSGCSGLVNVDIPESVTAIGDGAFCGCASLAHIDLPSGLQTIGSSAFASSGLRGIALPDSMKSLSGNAFENCESLSYIQMPDDDGGFSITGTFSLGSARPIILCYSYTYSEGWARDNALSYVLLDGNTFASLGSITVPARLRLPVGTAAALEPVLMPQLPDTPSGCAFASSDPNVVSVDAATGEMIALAAGDAEVTASAGGHSATTLVHVYVPLDNFRLKSVVWTEAGVPYTGLVTLVEPEDAEYTLSFELSDTSVADIDESGIITGTYAGTATIRATSDMDLTRTAELHVTLPVVRVAFTQPVWHIEFGDDIALTAQASPRKGEAPLNELLAFSSGNSAILTVELNGAAQSQAVGVALVTAVCQSGNCSDSAVVVVHSVGKLLLPADIKTIGMEAFAGTDPVEIVIPSGAETIAEGAFSDCASLRLIAIPESVHSIAADAFSGCTDVTILCATGSDAETFANTYGIPCIAE